MGQSCAPPYSRRPSSRSKTIEDIPRATVSHEPRAGAYRSSSATISEGVQVEPVPHREAREDGLREVGHLGGRADEEEGLEPELHQTCLAAADDRDRDRPLIDGLVEALRDRPGKAVDFVDEEHIPLSQRDEEP